MPFTPKDKEAQVNLRMAIRLSNIESVKQHLRENPAAVTIIEGPTPFEAAKEKETRTYRFFEQGRKTQAEVDRTEAVSKVVREATLKYAIDNEDIPLLERMKKATQFFDRDFSDGTNPQTYAQTHSKSKVLKWFKQQTKQLAKDVNTFFRKVDKARQLEEQLLKARAEHDAEILASYQQFDKDVNKTLNKALLGEKTSKCCGTKCTIM